MERRYPLAMMLRRSALSRIKVAMLLALICAATPATARTATPEGPSRPKDLETTPIPPRPVLPVPDGYQWPALMVGDRAPGIAVDDWITGRAVMQWPKEETSPGNRPVVVLEFWALWCGPCLAGMPHLTELQAKYGPDRLLIAGVTSPDRNNNIAAVREYVMRSPERIGYSIGWDIDRRTWKAYMEPAGRKAIPCAFVIDRDRRIAWIGHPARMDAALDAVVGGTWDLAAARRAHEQQILALEQGHRLLAEYRQAVKEKEWERTVTLARELLVLDADEFGLWSANAFGSILSGLKDSDRALTYANTLVDEGAPLCDRTDVLDRIATVIISEAEQPASGPPPVIAPEIMQLGLSAAHRANELAGNGASVAAMHTLARMQWVAGERSAAKATLKKAILIEDSEFRLANLNRLLDTWSKASETTPAPSAEPSPGPSRTP